MSWMSESIHFVVVDDGDGAEWYKFCISMYYFSDKANIIASRQSPSRRSVHFYVEFGIDIGVFLQSV